MSIHLCGIDRYVWKIISNSFTLCMGTTEVPLTDLQVKENDRLTGLNLKEMSILYRDLSKTEFNRISSYDTVQKIWNKLEVTHEGTNKVKKT